MKAIEVFNLHFSYDKTPTQWLLNGINFTVSPGECVAMIGRNGAGKSTLVKLICNQLQAQSGLVKINGRRSDKLTAAERAVMLSVVQQGIYSDFPFKVREVAAMSRVMRHGWLGRLTEEDNSAVEQALAACGLSGFEERIFSELSGGERQLVMLAGVLAQDSGILLLDEPTSAMDLGRSVEVMKLLNCWCRERNYAMLIISHNLELMARYVDRMVALKNGNIISDGPPRQVITPELIYDLYGFTPKIMSGDCGEVLLSY
ncbi:MAG: ABC transporter ATP-binding protein [Lentisphaeria bacterium]|nr:ABC transporter ATP-binding protein [Lentisphaeria bacterium]